MSSSLSSAWYTCKGCFQCMKWEGNEVENHTSSCKEYQKEMKRIKEQFAKQKKENKNSIRATK